MLIYIKYDRKIGKVVFRYYFNNVNIKCVVKMIFDYIFFKLGEN